MRTPSEWLADYFGDDVPEHGTMGERVAYVVAGGLLAVVLIAASLIAAVWGDDDEPLF